MLTPKKVWRMINVERKVLKLFDVLCKVMVCIDLGYFSCPFDSHIINPQYRHPGD